MGDAADHAASPLVLVGDVLAHVEVDVDQHDDQNDREEGVEPQLYLGHPLALLQGVFELVLARVAEADFGGEDVVELLDGQLFVDLLQVHGLLLLGVGVDHEVVFGDVKYMRQAMEFAELLAAALEVLHLEIADADCLAEVCLRLQLGVLAELAVVIQVLLEDVLGDGVVQLPLALYGGATEQFVFRLWAAKRHGCHAVVLGFKHLGFRVVGHVLVLGVQHLIFVDLVLLLQLDGLALVKLGHLEVDLYLLVVHRLASSLLLTASRGVLRLTARATRARA
mmetsp:Transcript_8609/g.13329  ORF Transcript_8609/g.13329 Transcript_8609/m.13329 type:complete len:280 (-) Transcript_8609:338-1177(-)